MKSTASYIWKGISGYWATASDWTPAGGPPKSTDSATINGSATTTVTVHLSDVAASLTLSDPNATLHDHGPGASLTIGTLTMSNGALSISVDGHGGVLTADALNLSGGILTIGPSGELNLNGTLSQTGGTLSLYGGTISGGTIDSTGGTVEFGGGTLSGVTFDGPLNLTSTSVVQAVHIANGTTVVGSSGSGAGTINATGIQSELDFDNTQTLSNDTINLGNSSHYDYLYEYDADGAGDQVLTLAGSVTVDVQGYAYIGAPGDYPGDGIANDGAIDQTGSGGHLNIAMSTFTNSGTIDAEATNGSLTIEPTTTFTNNGAIHVANGERVTVDPRVTGKGTFTISGDSTLEFFKGVSSAKTLGDQDIDFTGGGTLHLPKPASFYGEISGFATGDTIKLLGSWDFSGISEAGDVTTLTLLSGSTTHAFEFAGDYAQSDFSITPGNTTTIKYA
jgi:hypothetical protein